MSDDSDGRASKDRGTYLALVFLLLMAGLLLLLITAVLPKAIYLILILFGFALLLFLQYWTWGRWLTRYLQDKVPDDSEEVEEHLRKYGPHH